VPDTGDRYLVLQFVDAWTDNFAYVGTRATGNGDGTYLLTPPGWDGVVTGGMTRISFPTPVASIVGRLGCDGSGDLGAVAELQQQLTITPLADGNGAGSGIPSPDGAVADDLLFFEKLRVWSAAYPPNPDDLGCQQRFAPLALLEEGDSPYRTPEPALAEALAAATVTGKDKLTRVLRAGIGPRVNGWSSALHTFDYNTNYFELGTLDEPTWRINDPGRARLTRSIAALGGLWGNHGYEAAYFLVYDDGDGNTLNGSHRYEIRFRAAPPCHAFWSLTMYDLPYFYMVANPIDRYSIGDRTPGLRHGDDGSLALFLQTGAPSSPDSAANWLPTPAGDFRPILRIYAPGAVRARR